MDKNWVLLTKGNGGMAVKQASSGAYCRHPPSGSVQAGSCNAPARESGWTQVLPIWPERGIPVVSRVLMRPSPSSRVTCSCGGRRQAGRRPLGVWLRVAMFQSDSSCLRDISSFTAAQLSAVHMCSRKGRVLPPLQKAARR